MASYELNHLESKHVETNQLPRWACLANASLRLTGRLALLGWCFKWVGSWWRGLEHSHAFRYLLPSEGTAGRDGSDQHGPDDLFECKYAKLVTSFHRSQETAASLATHASATIAFIRWWRPYWLRLVLQREEQPFGWSSCCLNCLDSAFGAEVQSCKQETDQRRSRQPKSLAFYLISKVWCKSSPWPSWQKRVGDASGRPASRYACSGGGGFWSLHSGGEHRSTSFPN